MKTGKQALKQLLKEAKEIYILPFQASGGVIDKIFGAFMWITTTLIIAMILIPK